MTPGAENDQVFLCIGPQAAPRVDVVDLEVGRAAAVLAAPAVPLQNLLAELAVRVRVEAEAGPAPARE